MSSFELFKRHQANPILNVNDLSYPANSVFNAGCTIFNNETLLFLRVEDREGISHFTKARSKNGIDQWNIDKKPTMESHPEKFPEECWGIEDPRITFLEDLGKWAVAYTAYSGNGPLVSLALTQDFISFKRLGITTTPENKDAALFPVKFNGLWALIHRPVPRKSGSKGNIWISFSPDLKYWGRHKPLLLSRNGGFWDSSKIGLSAQPIHTEEGWLLLYHGVKKLGSISIYRLGLALLDSNDPTIVRSRPSEWVFSPQMDYERIGDVGNVTFSCGWTLERNTLKIYYGGADTTMCLATGKLDEVLEFLVK
jgi:predicted GH43/DUF377 family glycosyl hydrolase